MGDYSTVEIRGDNEGLKDSLDGAIGLFKLFGDHVTSLFQQAVGVYSFDDALSKIKKGIADFEQSEEHIHQLDLALGRAGSVAGYTTETLMKMNEEIQKVSKYSQDTITNAQTALAKFKNIRAGGGIFQDTLKAATDLAAYMQTDLPHAATILGAALNDPRKGLEALEEAGLDLSKSQLRAIEAMLRLGKVVDAQKLILQAMNEQMGGEGERAANTFGVRMAKLDEATTKMWKTIGGQLVPWINKAIDIMNDASTVVEALIDEWTSGWEDAGVTMEDVMKVLTDWFDIAVESGVVAFTYIQTAIENWETTAKGVFYTVKSVAMETFASILETVNSWVEKAVAVWPTIQKAALEAWQKVVELAGWGKDQLIKYWDSFVSYTKSVWETIWMNAEDFWTKLKLLMTGQNPGDWMWRDFTRKAEVKLDEVPKLFGDLGGKIPDMKDTVAKMRDGAARAAEDAEEAWGPFFARFAGNYMGNTDAVNKFRDKIKKILADAGYKDIAGYNSDAKFKLSTPDEEEGHHGAVGNMEDFAASHARIQSAAFKMPSLKELEKQTKLMEREAQIQEAMLELMRQDRIAKFSKPATPPAPALNIDASNFEAGFVA